MTGATNGASVQVQMVVRRSRSVESQSSWRSHHDATVVGEGASYVEPRTGQRDRCAAVVGQRGVHAVGRRARSDDSGVVDDGNVRPGVGVKIQRSVVRHRSEGIARDGRCGSERTAGIHRHVLVQGYNMEGIAARRVEGARNHERSIDGRRRRRLERSARLDGNARRCYG